MESVKFLYQKGALTGMGQEGYGILDLTTSQFSLTDINSLITTVKSLVLPSTRNFLVDLSDAFDRLSSTCRVVHEIYRK